MEPRPLNQEVFKHVATHGTICTRYMFLELWETKRFWLTTAREELIEAVNSALRLGRVEQARVYVDRIAEIDLLLLLDRGPVCTICKGKGYTEWSSSRGGIPTGCGRDKCLCQKTDAERAADAEHERNYERVC